MEVNHAIPIWRFMEFRKEGVKKWVTGSAYKELGYSLYMT